MFNKDFYPTPPDVIELMINGESLSNRIVLEPSSGKGNIIDVLKQRGAEVLCCESDPDLARICAGKARLINTDFLAVKSDEISHIHAIYMNPPFSADEKHILHAWEIAPSGCVVVALCNHNTLSNDYSRSRKTLLSIIKDYGNSQNLGDVFSDSERQTGVEIGLIRLFKPVSNGSFGDYFTSEDDDPEANQNGIMSYNAVREIVQRYVNAVLLYDQVVDNGIKMNSLIGEIAGYSKDLVFTCTQDNKELTRTDFAKELQKKSWNWIFNKLNMQKYATRGLRDDINKFVEQQVKIPFTMKNIYKMLDLIVGTQSQRMDKALLEVFDRLTMRYHENRYGMEGWKTNSHYLVNQKFILDSICWQDQRWYKGESKIQVGYHLEILEDLMKALCYITGERFEDKITLNQAIKYNYKVQIDDITVRAYLRQSEAESRIKEYASKGVVAKLLYEPDHIYGQWFDWTYFECKAFKKGTMHFKFRSENVWVLFNQHIGRIKGFPLPESVRRKAA